MSGLNITKQTQLKVKELTAEQLKKQLITSDYGGREWKEACLQELLNRENTQGQTG
jgi:hypothetical protein